MSRKLKLLVMGHARHGKDAACEILRDRYGLQFVSSSRFVLEAAVWPRLRQHYADIEECFADRYNRRSEWFDAISAYNRPDPARLGSELFAQYDLYCGLRSAREFHALKIAGVFDFAIWLDASERCPPEPRTSCTVEAWMADFVLDNNGTLADLSAGIDRLMTSLASRVSKVSIANRAKDHVASKSRGNGRARGASGHRNVALGKARSSRRGHH